MLRPETASATSIVAVVIATIVLSYSSSPHCCVLEPSVSGGFTISYPRLGLFAYSGNDTTAILKTFETSLQIKNVIG